MYYICILILSFFCDLVLITGEVFRVKGSGSRQMQRIGARDQRCLLHLSKWGMTLALERTRAVLAQWPLTTIRSYEALDANEFIFEAGRASPMGEGKYNFFTQNGEDNKIFDVIDNFASARLRRQQGIHSPAASHSQLTDDDIERAYDQLRFSVSMLSTVSGISFVIHVNMQFTILCKHRASSPLECFLKQNTALLNTLFQFR